MVDDNEVTQWLGRLAQGDEAAAQQIWDRYCRQLAGLARRKLGDFPRRAADEEDVVLSAFNSFCQAAATGRFPQLRDRDDLWRLLVTITARKAVAQLRREHYQKRGSGAVRGESVFAPARPNFSEAGAGIDGVLGDAPTPAFAADVSEQCARLLGLLEDESLRAVALSKLEGYTNEELAAKLNCALSTVERKLARIRKKWEGEMPI